MLLHQQSISLLYLLNKKKRETVTGKKKYRRKPILYQIRKRKEKEKKTQLQVPNVAGVSKTTVEACTTVALTGDLAARAVAGKSETGVSPSALAMQAGFGIGS
jgi:predicted transcriptional regulator